MPSSIVTAMKMAFSEISVCGVVRETRGTFSREILGARVEVDPNTCLLSTRARHAKLRYAAAEILWYLSGSSWADDLKHWAPNYRKLYADEYGAVPDAYGARSLAIQLCRAHDLFKHDPSTRRAFLSIWNLVDLKEAKDTVGVPCCIGLHFIMVEGSLEVFGMCRSSDLYRGFPYDVFSFCFLGRVIAAELGVPFSCYTHLASTLHIYDKEQGKLSQMYTEQQIDGFPWEWDYQVCDKPANTAIASCEEAGKLFKHYTRKSPEYHSTLASQIKAITWAPVRDLLAIAFTKFDPRYFDLIESPSMRQRLVWEDGLQ